MIYHVRMVTKDRIYYQYWTHDQYMDYMHYDGVLHYVVDVIERIVR